MPDNERNEGSSGGNSAGTEHAQKQAQNQGQGPGQGLGRGQGPGGGQSLTGTQRRSQPGQGDRGDDLDNDDRSRDGQKSSAIQEHDEEEGQFDGKKFEDDEDEGAPGKQGRRRGGTESGGTSGRQNN